ncbi:transglutaminase family protein [Mycobacterium tuberculosis]|nr:transglutaminase family protein [Mycobacterium tuberculosis]
MPYPAPEQAAARHAAAPRAAAPASWAADAALSGLLLLLLLEWLYPLRRLADITEVTSIAPFAVTFVFLVAADTLRLPGWALWPIKMLWIVGMTAWLHNGQAVPSPDWWAGFGRELRLDAAEGLAGNLAAWEPATRTLLFMTGWAFFISVLQSFVLERRQVLWFWGMTLFFLAFVQLVFSVDMFPAVLRSTGISLLLQGLLQQGRWHDWLVEESDASSQPLVSGERNAVMKSFAAPLAGLLIAAAFMAAGWLGTLLHPQEMRELDWSRYIRAFGERFHSEAWNQRHTAGMANTGRTGYSSDDTRLGQPLQPDQSPVFIAVTPRLTYWRGEAKSYYTGQGWLQPDSRMAQYWADPPGWNPGAAAEREYFVPVKQTIRIQDPALSRQLFAGGELIRIHSLQSAGGQSIPVNLVWRQLWSERITLPVMTDPLAEYEIESLAPADRTALKGLLGETDASYPPEIKERFLQLPDSLPERVKQLAASITGGVSSPYAKAEAIERYLREHYAYSLQETRAVQGREDVADRFLFEQKTGYCDHFSTAMVVLLRSVGVPARWVKGFAPGEVLAVDGEGGSERYTVQVRQNNAHSWAEVYFPSVGWVPFEPTPAYSATAGEGASASPASAAPAANVNGWVERLIMQFLSGADALLSMAGTIRGSLSTAFSAAGAFIPKLLSLPEISFLEKLFLGMAAAGMAAFILLKHMWTKNIRTPSPSAGSVTIAVHSLRRAALQRFGERLWRRLQRSYGRAAPSMTLREYAASRRCRTETQRMALLRLTRQLETLHYADPNCPDTAVTRRTLAEAWRRLKLSL